MTNKATSVGMSRLDLVTAMAVALIFGILQLQFAPVYSQRQRIRGEQVRPDRNRLSGGYVYQRPSRNTPPVSYFPDIPDNNNNNNNNNENENEIQPTPNLVLLPQCDPFDPISFYNSNNNSNSNNNNNLEDKTTDCDRYLQYCGKKYSGISFNSWASYVYPDDFYDTVELMYDRCFASCVETLPGGVNEFCAMPEALPQEPAESSYCFSAEDGETTWTDELIAEEANVLSALNKQRDDRSGATCQRRYRDPNTGEIRVVSGFFPRSSPVVPNEALRCAARIQAKNIVDETIETGRFPPNLHNACPSRGDAICEDFSTRMDKAGYTYFTNGFGNTNEVTAAGYRSAESVVKGWKASTSGHCEAILKQESKIVPTEVGIGYYKDPVSGMTGHVVILAQRNL